MTFFKRKNFKPRKSSEKNFFENKVKKALKSLDGNWFIKTNVIQFVGLPDVIGCYQGRFYAWELKTENGKPTKRQMLVLNAIRLAGGVAEIVRPSTLDFYLERLKK